MTLVTNEGDELIYAGVVIHRWDKMLSLTDMWRAAAGSEEARQSGEWVSRSPAQWYRSADAKRFIDALAEVLTVGNSHDGLYQVVRRGGNEAPDTRAHWQIGLAYAKYLSPEFHMWTNTVVKDRMEGRIGPPVDQMAAMMAILRDPAKAMALIGDYATRLLAADAKTEQATMQRDEAAARANTLAVAHDRFASHEGSFAVTVAAKTLKIPPKKLFAWLAAKRWIYRPGGRGGYVAYQDKIKSEFLVHATHEIKMTDGNIEEVSQARITTKGLDKIAIAMELPPIDRGPEPPSNVLDLRGGKGRSA